MQLVMETESTQGKHCDGSTLSTTNPTLAGIELNTSLRGERQSTDRLNNGKSVVLQKYFINFQVLSLSLSLTHTHTHTHTNTH